MSNLVKYLRDEADAAENGGCPLEASKLREAADALEKQHWQPWPPPEGVEELIAWHDDEMRHIKRSLGRWFDARGDWLYDPPPTHWQPMPDAPEETT